MNVYDETPLSFMTPAPSPWPRRIFIAVCMAVCAAFIGYVVVEEIRTHNLANHK